MQCNYNTTRNSLKQQIFVSETFMKKDAMVFGNVRHNFDSIDVAILKSSVLVKSKLPEQKIS